MSEKLTEQETKLLVVAKQVWDNMPFENPLFKPQSVNDCAKQLANLLKNKYLGQSWIDHVYQAASDNQPIYITLNKEWVWNFLTKTSGTRQEIIDEMSKINWEKVKIENSVE